MKSLEGIPDFLRITPAARAATWARHPPKAMPLFNDTSRRAPLTEHDREVIAAFEAMATSKKLDRTAEGLAELAEHKAAKAAAEAEAAKAAAPTVITTEMLEARKATPKAKRTSKATPRKPSVRKRAVRRKSR